MSFIPPATTHLETLFLRTYFQFRLLGVENVSTNRPALYVSNHTLISADIPMLVSQLHHETGIYLRPLADDIHGRFPAWKKAVEKKGVVIATPENCTELMTQAEHVLVYPGGFREVMKNRDSLNDINWEGRKGFARMAIENNYPIIPIASLGGDEAYKYVLDSEQVDRSIFGRTLRHLGITRHLFRDGEILPPIVRGIGLSAIPRPQPCSIMLGKPIDSTQFQLTDSGIEELKTAAQNAIRKQMATLKAERRSHQKKYPVRYLINRYT